MILQPDISELLFYVDLVYTFKRISGKPSVGGKTLNSLDEGLPINIDVIKVSRGQCDLPINH